MKRKQFLGLALFSILLGGCGGGGALNNGGNGATGSINVFVTDSFETDHSHVWARIYRVETVGLNGGTETLFNDSEGVLIDLKTLRDTTGQRFAFLGRTSISFGVQTQVRVTIANSFQLFRTGETTGREVAVSSALPRDSNNYVPLTFPLTASRTLANDNFVIDFDLANFALTNNAVTPSLKEGGTTGLTDALRQEPQDSRGTISGLSGTTSADYRFALTLVSGAIVNVTTTADTVIYNANSTSNPTLANGKIVEVTGKFDAASGRLIAASIKIKPTDETISYAKVSGVPSELAATTGRFRVGANRARNFVPAETTVPVITTGSTLFRSNNGVPVTSTEFFALLANASGVEVEGTYDTTTKVLTAVRAKIEDAREQKRAEITGTPTNILSGVRIFRIDPILESEGYPTPTQPVTVSTTGSTKFTDKDGNELTIEAFFAQLATAGRVKVNGTISGTNAVVAVRAQLKANQ